MVEGILADIICQTFEKEPGRDQNPFLRPGNDPKCFLVSFSLHIDHATEEGYRHIDLLLYAPSRYVQVWTRIRSTIIPLTDLTDEDDSVPLPGKKYKDTVTPWSLHGDHDSCWRDAVRRIIFDNRDKLSVVDGFKGWYQVLPVPQEIIDQYKIERAKR